jgi:hypothetical protein
MMKKLALMFTIGLGCCCAQADRTALTLSLRLAF